MLDNAQYDLTSPASHAGRALTLPRAVRVLIRTATSRRQLRDMEPRMLDDIGITRAEALAEAARAPWHNGPRFRAGFHRFGMGLGPWLMPWRLLGGGMFVRRPPG